MSPHPLRDKTVDVTREHGGLADIGAVEELHEESFETYAEAAVRGETPLVGVEVALEVGGVETLCL